MRIFFTLLAIFTFLITWSQRLALSPDQYDTWNRIGNFSLSSKGNLSSYHLQPGFGDHSMVVVDSKGNMLLEYPRAESSAITWDESFVAFKIVPAMDTVRALKRRKTKKEGMPQDSLGIFRVEDKKIDKIAPLKDFMVPEEWSGYVAIRVAEVRELADEKDTTSADKGNQPKKVSKENGFHLILLELATMEKDTFKYVTDYAFAKEAPHLLFESTGLDSTFEAGVYHYDISNEQLTALMIGDHSYQQHSISRDGSQVAFLVDTDTTKALLRDFHLMYWKKGMARATSIVHKGKLENDWIVNKYAKTEFSADGSKLYFGTCPQPIVQDTTLLEDEIIQVEVWSYEDVRLMTEQEKNKKEDKEKYYQAVYHMDQDRFVQLTDEVVTEIEFANQHKKDLNLALVYNNRRSYKQVSWEGFPPRQDLYVVDLRSGKRTEVAKAKRAYATISPSGKYVVWYDRVDSAWFSFNIKTQTTVKVSVPTKVYDELDDHPDYPYAYGSAGWTANDDYFLIYDRYDVWKTHPDGTGPPANLTNGRPTKIKYRLPILDQENPEIDLKRTILHTFNETSKAEGYVQLNGDKIKPLISGDFKFDGLVKAKQNDVIAFTKSSHQVFPDYHLANLSFKNPIRISNANPQQKYFKWSTVELITWNSLQGEPLNGLLYKPEDFDASNTYPMIVYFYERNSDNLHRYHGSFPHRSIINPAYYASRGYVIFVPDIVYQEGYPGKSCYDAVIPGVMSILSEGSIDRNRIGMQGHSWGGYQTAYLSTQTDLFACAESGAPVSNMVSAYGGIRWGSGLSRMFQYERTQSRIGGTLWEYPMRYIENSPIFYADKINTPLLIMHNDKDGAVPWYQGIEFFVALRRLGKTAWMLNYNDEPHWPTKRENIKDFQVRMQQFFDHYLMGQPMPEWMAEGIPATEKGINKGYELKSE